MSSVTLNFVANVKSKWILLGIKMIVFYSSFGVGVV